MARRIHPAFHALILAIVMLGCASDGIETSVAFDPLTQFPTQATFLWDSSSSKRLRMIAWLHSIWLR